MLAAFPPPAQPAQHPSARASWFRSSASWPLGQGRNSTPSGQATTVAHAVGPESEGSRKGKRRCCGLPLWAFILVAILVLGIIAAAIILPLEFFVFRNQAQATALADCQSQLECANGGTNVISQDVCSCICTNGFTGANCTVSSAAGCTTSTLVSPDGQNNIEDVTLGQAVPRLIADAQGNFSVPLSGTAILAGFNSASLSCQTQNALVTFNDESTRVGAADDVVSDVVEAVNNAALDALYTTVVGVPTGETSTVTIGPDATGAVDTHTVIGTTVTITFVSSAESTTTTAPSSTITPSSTSTLVTSDADPSALFLVTEEVLDFARVAVLYVLQESGVQAASTAQTNLQKFLSDAIDTPDGTTPTEAAGISLGEEGVVNLVEFSVDVGEGGVGGRNEELERRVVSRVRRGMGVGG